MPYNSQRVTKPILGNHDATGEKIPMKKLIRIAVLMLGLAGMYAAASVPQSMPDGNGMKRPPVHMMK